MSLKEKILVTGGYGLVGMAIQTICKDYDYEFIFLDSKMCDLRNLNDTKYLFKVYNPDYVIHLAANVGGLYKNINQKTEMFEDNLLINLNLIKCCHLFKVKKCVAVLSTCVFPDKVDYPINESSLHIGPPHSSNEGYAYAKRMLEIQCKLYNEQYGDNFVCVIPTNIYGPNDNFSLEDGHVIPSLIHKCYLAKKENKLFIVKGSGSPLRQFIYSEDLAKLIMIILEKYTEKESTGSWPSIILSVSEKDEISIRDVSELILNSNKYNNIQFDTNCSDGQYKKTADNTRLMSFIKEKNINFNFTSIKEGIQKTVDWFNENYDNPNGSRIRK